MKSSPNDLAGPRCSQSLTGEALIWWPRCCCCCCCSLDSLQTTFSAPLVLPRPRSVLEFTKSCFCLTEIDTFFFFANAAWNQNKKSSFSHGFLKFVPLFSSFHHDLAFYESYSDIICWKPEIIMHNVCSRWMIHSMFLWFSKILQFFHMWNWDPESPLKSITFYPRRLWM